MTAPVLAVAVIAPLAPTLTVATAKAFEPVVPVMCRMPSFCAVATSATTSGTAVVEAESSNVLSPELTGAAGLLTQAAVMAMSVGANAAETVSEEASIFSCYHRGRSRPVATTSQTSSIAHAAQCEVRFLIPRNGV